MEEQEWLVEFSWIKAHAGHHGNELADQLAEENKQQDHSISATLESQTVQCGVN